MNKSHFLKLVILNACLAFLAIVSVPSLQAQIDTSQDGVTVKNQEAYRVQGGQMSELTENVKFAHDIEVSTNGTFKVADGKERSIDEGQILRSDGWLLNSDGSLWPAFDYVAQKAGKVVVVRDGQAKPLDNTMNFPNGMSISADGWCTYPDNRRSRMLDGQMFQLDGTPIQGRDTVTFRNGQVVVQKDGALITLSPPKTMGLNDGSKVESDGSIVQRDGSKTQLKEGQTVIVPGLNVSN